MAKLRPLGDKILVKRVEAESKTKSGIVLPDTAKEKPTRGKVLAVGDGKRLDTASASPSASRRATKSSSPATPAPRSSSTAKKLMIMSEDDVLAVVE